MTGFLHQSGSVGFFNSMGGKFLDVSGQNTEILFSHFSHLLIGTSVNDT